MKVKLKRLAEKKEDEGMWMTRAELACLIFIVMGVGVLAGRISYMIFPPREEPITLSWHNGQVKAICGNQEASVRAGERIRQ